MCQRATGGVFAALAGAAPDNFAWTRGTPSFFASSNLAKRGFCEKCGTPLSFRYDSPTARMYTTIGSLDRPEHASIIKQCGIESRLPWVKFCEEVPGSNTSETPEEQAFFAKLEDNTFKPGG
jgi:hypothetical protein